VLDVYRGIALRMKNMKVHIFPGMLHGYMMRGSTKAFHPVTRDFSMARALAILDGLRDGRVSQSLRHAS
jgi:carboxymethylenebutenolidase